MENDVCLFSARYLSKITGNECNYYPDSRTDTIRHKQCGGVFGGQGWETLAWIKEASHAIPTVTCEVPNHNLGIVDFGKPSPKHFPDSKSRPFQKPFSLAHTRRSLLYHGISCRRSF